MWRLVVEQVATLQEIDEHWTIEDVLDANEALDVFDDAQVDELQPPDLPASDSISLVVSVKGKPGGRR